MINRVQQSISVPKSLKKRLDKYAEYFNYSEIFRRAVEKQIVAFEKGDPIPEEFQKTVKVKMTALEGQKVQKFLEKERGT